MQWPPNSADLNLIESLLQIKKKKKIHSKELTQNFLTVETIKVWSSLKRYYHFFKLIESMPREQMDFWRLKKVQSIIIFCNKFDLGEYFNGYLI